MYLVQALSSLHWHTLYDNGSYKPLAIRASLLVGERAGIARDEPLFDPSLNLQIDKQSR